MMISTASHAGDLPPAKETTYLTPWCTYPVLQTKAAFPSTLLLQGQGTFQHAAHPHTSGILMNAIYRAQQHRELTLFWSTTKHLAKPGPQQGQP